MPAVEGGSTAFRPLWVHEIKHDGYRLMVRLDGPRVRFTRGGHNWGDRFPAIVDAAQRLKVQSFLIDGEVVITGDECPALSLLDLDQRWQASRFEDRNSRVLSLMR
jgi:ATP-dependent DNA ligase